MPVRKSRTTMSCDRCKSRKTKCNNPNPGPCDYCRSIGAQCQIDVGKRRQRPYYSVSQEEFRYMQSILRHLLPDAELTLPALRTIASQYEEQEDHDNELPSEVDHAPRTSFNTDVQGGEQVAEPSEDDVLHDIVDLQEDLGCMLADARGEYRYIGPESGIAFNSAIRGLKGNTPKADKDNNVIPGFEIVTMPLPSSKTPTAEQVTQHVNLPAKDVCLRYASRYFEEVHCLHWLFSSEQFHTRLEATYNNRESANSSWPCSLYCIFALGSIGTSVPNDVQNRLSGGEYLDLAKSLVPSVCDEADLDSIRALILLALALQSYAFSNSAYLYTGTAVRIAFSLGLHLDKYPSSYDLVQKEHARRIWWSLHVLDQEVALRVGKPSMTGAPTGLSWQPPLPSEQILNSGPYTPPGYLRISISLTQLVHSARDTLYGGSGTARNKLCPRSVGAALSSLRQWLDCVPTYLSPTSPAAPLHRRSITFLHVRYWSAVILVSRPFLLCNLLRRTQLQGTPQARYFEELSSVCVNAAEESLKIMQRMADEQVLSNIVVADFYYALDVLQVFLVAFATSRYEKHLDNTRKCLEVLRAMESAGVCHKMLPEVIKQLRDWGVHQSSSEVTSNAQDFETSLMDIQPGSELYDLLFNTNEPTDANTSELFFTDLDFFDGATSDALMQQIMEMSDMPSGL